jgi:hypothetical protein
VFRAMIEARKRRVTDEQLRKLEGSSAEFHTACGLQQWMEGMRRGSDMQLTLGSEQAILLQRVLGKYVSDLKMEIAGTEDYELRKALQADEVVLKGIIARLGEAEPSVGLDRKAA